MKRLLFKNKMTLTILLFSLLLSSCNKDSDLFYENVQESIDENQSENEPDNPDEPDENPGESVVDNEVSTELKAFPGAYGAGAGASGFRGGEVIHVTSLSDDGSEGTWRWAITREYPRIIVFDVSGVIELQSSIFLNDSNSNVYVAGQTSPNGIMIKGWHHTTQSLSHGVFRFIKFYQDPNASARRPAIQNYYPSNLIFDHCDFVYTQNEAINFWSDANAPGSIGGNTLQNCLIGEGVTGVLFGADSGHKGAGEGTSWRNLFTHISHRTPNFQADVLGEQINSVTYNTRARLSLVLSDAQVNFYGNYHKAGPSTAFNIASDEAEGQKRRNLVKGQEGARAYVDNDYWSFMSSIVESKSDVITDAFINSTSGSSFASKPQPSLSTFIADQPVQLTKGVRPPIVSNAEAFEIVLSSVGARYYLNSNGTYDEVVDAKMEQYIYDVINGTNSDWPSNPYYYGNENGVYNPPTIENSQRASNYDTDKDGMPDIWEVANGFNPDVADDSGDADGDGYTNIEEFLNLVDSLN